MSDPMARGASVAPPVLGEGCTQRYDPQALTTENGAEFAQAAELWREMQQRALLQAEQDAQSEASQGVGSA
ncbi:hypothetical protein [Pseudomonas sp.]|jgi:hypothetical protein|uniref:hypothetical protein n=1 Tax=Pseudomonas sp. TaxID=306 RepID=UPI0037C8DF2F